MAVKTISRISALSCLEKTARPAKSRGFTLVELLVVIGIIAIIIGFTIPAVMKARIAGAKTAQKLEFESIATALDAYKNDVGEYPPVTYQDSGAEVLGKALMGPGQASLTAGGPPFSVNQFVGTGSGPYWACLHANSSLPTAGDPNWQQLTISYADLNDSFGFRQRPQGKVFGPYLDASKFHMRGLQILDHWDHPVLYFAGNTIKPNINTPSPGGSAIPYISTNLATFPYVGQMSTVADASNSNLYNGAKKNGLTSLFDAGDNISAFIRSGESPTGLPPVLSPVTTSAFKRIAMLLGDYNPSTPAATTNFNGLVDNSETAVTVPFVLWSSGSDGFFGTTSTTPSAGELQKCDDVTNVTP